MEYYSERIEKIVNHIESTLKLAEKYFSETGNIDNVRLNVAQGMLMALETITGKVYVVKGTKVVESHI